MINRREAVQVFGLACLRAVIAPAWLPAMSGVGAGARPKAGGPSTLAPFHVVHGWPDLPEAYFLGQVSGIGVDSQERVFLFHRSDHSVPNGPIEAPAVLCIDGKTGKLLDSWGAHMFIRPHGLRVDGHGNVWLTDLLLHQVFKFTHDGKLTMSVGTAHIPGCDDKHFNLPTDIAVGPDGSFYVSDGYGNSRIAKFSPEGRFLLDWGRAGDKPGEFNTPHNVLIGPDGRIYVADRGNDRMQIFTGDGKFITEWKGPELGRPWGLANAPDGFIYMVDGGDYPAGPANRGRMMRLDLRGNVLEKWGSAGRYDGQLWLGHDLAVGKSGDVYVGDVNLGMRVQKFSRSEVGCLCLPR
jgi:peptidylamidoglycolate lyase